MNVRWEQRVPADDRVLYTAVLEIALHHLDQMSRGRIEINPDNNDGEYSELVFSVINSNENRKVEPPF